MTFAVTRTYSVDRVSGSTVFSHTAVVGNHVLKANVSITRPESQLGLSHVEIDRALERKILNELRERLYGGAP
jgi:hypothetical protein